MVGCAEESLWKPRCYQKTQHLSFTKYNTPRLHELVEWHNSYSLLPVFIQADLHPGNVLVKGDMNTVIADLEYAN